MKKLLLVETAVIVKPQSALLESAGGRGYVVEAIEGTPRIRVKLPATTLDKKNENGRVYSTSVMEGTCRKAAPMFTEKRLLSSVNEHPEEPYVTPGQASHIVTKAWCDGAYMMNEWEILDTASGKDLRALIEAGAAFGVSIRGLGSVDNFGNIQDDYEYLGTDCVGQPSAQIWTAPQEVQESIRPTPSTSSPNLNESSQGNPAMKSKAAADKYVREQVILMGSEGVMEAVSRIMAVESVLAASTVPAAELTEAYSALNEAKARFSKPAVNESADKAAFRAQIVKMSETFKGQMAAVRAELVTKDKELAEAARKADVQAKASKFFKAKYETLLGKHTDVLAESTKAKAKYEAVLRRAGRAVAGYAASRGLAVETTMKYNWLLKQTANMIKERKKAPAATAAPVKQTESVVRTSTVPSKTVEKVARKETSANRNGTTCLPNFI